jgi:predicted RNA-binding Zn ribbon-like protein
MGTDLRFGPARWAQLAVALVNTAPTSRLPDTLTRSGDLRDLLLAHDEPDPVKVSARDLADARETRTALAAVFAAGNDPVLVARLLNELLASTAEPRLVTHAGVPLHLHLDAPGASWGGWLAATGSMALALLVADHGIEVLGRCEADGCSHAVLHLGPGPKRRFCDSTCASRTRVAAHRAGRKASATTR